MKKTLLFVLVLILSISLIGCVKDKSQTDKADRLAVENLVINFGKQLQNVSLQAPIDIVKKSMQDYYGSFVSQTLLAKWMNDPQKAPGRLVSSPWPDRIDILSIDKVSENEYQVKGEIIEITSNEVEHGGIAAKRPITLIVRKINNRWIIDDVTLGAYENSNETALKAF